MKRYDIRLPLLRSRIYLSYYAGDSGGGGGGGSYYYYPAFNSIFFFVLLLLSTANFEAASFKDPSTTDLGSHRV